MTAPHWQQPDGLLRFITCGSVDDGKSTLIGRLLFDSKAVLADQLEAITTTSHRRGLSKTDLSLLTDGLVAEREQGITIDVAYRYFSTARRRFIIADTPGHVQYTRNMVTGASTADLAILLVDVRRGVLEQTRRHAHIVRLLGIRHVVVAVNKMDLVDYDQAAFIAVRDQFQAFAAEFDFESAEFVPMSALEGEGVVAFAGAMAWHQGPSLLEILETVPLDEEALRAPFRFPVQGILRDGESDFQQRRGYTGLIAAGEVAVGDPVMVLPAGVKTAIESIVTFEGPLERARAGQSVTLKLMDQVDISRGDMIAAADQPPRQDRILDTLLCWFSGTPLDPNRRFLVRHGSQTVAARVGAVVGRLDVNTSRIEGAPERVSMNDIVEVELRLQNPVAADAYEIHRANGGFILVDALSNDTVAAGLIR